MLSFARSGSHHGGLCGVLALVACVRAAGIEDSGSSSSTGNVEGSPTPSDLPIDGDAAERRDGNFLDPIDVGEHGRQCDLWSQDCPAGEKCSVFADDGGSWNATKCFPIDPDPAEVGQACTVFGSPASGFDSCARGSVCWDVDQSTGEGVCVGFCNGSEANPTCSDPSLHCVGRDVTLCLPSCCPLEQSCAERLGCYPVVDTFECAPDASGDNGSFGDTCDFINVCDIGLFCADVALVPGCDGDTGCCTPYCEIGNSTCAAVHPDLECVPWFEPGYAPFGEEHVGGCMLPE